MVDTVGHAILPVVQGDMVRRRKTGRGGVGDGVAAAYIGGHVGVVIAVAEGGVVGGGKPEPLRRPKQDSKGALQAFLQKDGGTTPVYETIGQSGPPHDRGFEAAVSRDGRELGRGSGRTKKQAEQAAALDALRRLGAADVN